MDVEGYDGGVTSASTYMYYDRIVRITKSCSVLVHRYNDVSRRYVSLFDKGRHGSVHCFRA